MHVIIKENIVKNTIIAILIAISYPIISSFIKNSDLLLDKGAAGNMIVVTSIIAVAACFGNFAFKYEKINVNNTFQRYLAHFTTGIFMLLIGISFIFTAMLTTIIMGYFFMIDLTLFLLYLGCVGYDFWDVYRVSR